MFFSLQYFMIPNTFPCDSQHFTGFCKWICSSTFGKLVCTTLPSTQNGIDQLVTKSVTRQWRLNPFSLHTRWLSTVARNAIRWCDCKVPLRSLPFVHHTDSQWRQAWQWWHPFLYIHKAVQTRFCESCTADSFAKPCKFSMGVDLAADVIRHMTRHVTSC